VNGKTLGIILIVAGIGSVIAGIVLKRVFAMGEFVFAFHGVGGLLLVIGISMAVLGKSEKK
jgi:hypothetical protein